ncbi:hypothetical protein TNCV_3279511 [Trichonephila clavipes]|nr:hypothetical protein TNCV_3279511 [Trichonephila clavipes]
MRAIHDELRNTEACSINEDNAEFVPSYLNFHTTPVGICFSSDISSMLHFPRHGRPSAVQAENSNPASNELVILNLRKPRPLRKGSEKHSNVVKIS